MKSFDSQDKQTPSLLRACLLRNPCKTHRLYFGPCTVQLSTTSLYVYDFHSGVRRSRERFHSAPQSSSLLGSKSCIPPIPLRVYSPPFPTSGGGQGSQDLRCPGSLTHSPEGPVVRKDCRPPLKERERKTDDEEGTTEEDRLGVCFFLFTGLVHEGRRGLTREGPLAPTSFVPPTPVTPNPTTQPPTRPFPGSLKTRRDSGTRPVPELQQERIDVITLVT